jgi:hypothetical protein
MSELTREAQYAKRRFEYWTGSPGTRRRRLVRAGRRAQARLRRLGRNLDGGLRRRRLLTKKERQRPRGRPCPAGNKRGDGEHTQQRKCQRAAHASTVSGSVDRARNQRVLDDRCEVVDEQ